VPGQKVSSFMLRLKNEIARWTAIIKAANIKGE
jgi:hypothetical protein